MFVFLACIVSHTVLRGFENSLAVRGSWEGCGNGGSNRKRRGPGAAHYILDRNFALHLWGMMTHELHSGRHLETRDSIAGRRLEKHEGTTRLPKRQK